MTSALGDLAGQHPHEMVLADYVDGLLADEAARSVEGHLAACPACRSLIEKMNPADGPQPEGGPTWSVADSPQLPAGIREALAERRVTNPAAGQVWRLRGAVGAAGEELTALAVLLRVGEELLVAPVTTDTQEATDLWTIQLPLIGEELELAAWVSLETPVGWEVLDVLLGTVDAEPLLTVHRALRRGQEPPRGLPLGRPLDDELQEYRERLRARLVEMSEARISGPAWMADEDAETQETSDVSSALKEAGWDLGRLAKVAEISLRDAREVLVDKRTLSLEQRERVERELQSTSLGTVRRLNRAWAHEVASPVFRARFEAVAERQGKNGWQFRGEQAFEPAAARGNQGSGVDWHELVEQRLRRLEAELED